MTTDAEWEKWGSRDPYFGVLTQPHFRSAALTADAKREFFHSGEGHVQLVLSVCHRHVAPGFTPRRVLDFGCGVGRVAIPFAAIADEVVGLDVSPSMLAEAQRNCDELGVGNLRLLPSDDELSAVEGDFDLVHTSIVLQHVPVARGRVLFERLGRRIRPGGIGALQVTFAWDLHEQTYGQPPPPPVPPPPTPAQRVKSWLRQLPGLRRPPPPVVIDESADPEMQMNYYNLSELLFIVQHRVGAAQVHVEMTNHGGALGAFIFFHKPG